MDSPTLLPSARADEAEARMLAAVAFAVEELFRADGWEQRIDGVLARLGGAAGASRALLVPVSPQWRSRAWTAPGAESWRLDLGRFAEALMRGETIVDGARLLAPIFSEGIWWGVLAFDDCGPHERGAIVTAARIIGAAIEQHERLSHAQLAVDAANVGTWDYNPVNDSMRVSDQFRAIFGFAPADRIDRATLMARVHPADHDHVEAEITRVLRGDTPGDYDVQYRVPRPDGSTIWVNGRGRAFFTETDGVRTAYRFIGTIVDITRQKEAEEALRASETRTRAIIEGAGLGIALITPEGRLLLTNAALCDFFGYPEHELIQLTPPDLTHPDDLAADFALFQELIAGTRQRYSIEKRYIRKDGRVVWARLTLSLVRQEGGDYAVAVVEDITERRTVAEKIRESEERFRLLAARINEVFYVTEPDPLRVLYVSPAYETIWQRPAELLYENPQGYVVGVHEDDRATLAAVLERQLTGEETELEYRVVRPDGTIRWLRDRGYPIVRDGRVFRIVGIAEDVTSAREAAEEVDRARERYALVAQATNDVIWDWDPLASTIVWSEDLRTMFGWDPQAIDNRLEWWDQHIHPDDRERVVAAITGAIESGASSWNDEYRFERADGSFAEVLDRGYISRAADGRPLRMIGAMLDVTERKYAERMARFMAEASALLASSLDYASTLMRVADLAVPVLADWCLVDLRGESGGCERIAVAHGDTDEMQLAFEHGATREVHEVIASGKALHGEQLLIVPLAAPDRPAIGALTLMMNESRRTFGERDLHVAEDLARRAAMAVEHARLYAEAQEANRMKDEFLATLSHELRTPLTAILGWARMLDEPDLDPQTQRLGIETIQTSAAAQARLIDDVLDVSRVISGKMHLHVEPVPIERVVRSSVDAVRLAAAAKNITLVVPHTNDGLVTGDADRLQQVVWNLLTNAIKFTPAGGRVDVTVESAGDVVRLAVRDTGHGIAPEFLPHVFEPFRQGETGATRTQGGLGLGLAIVRYIVEAHGGTVSVSSEGPGRGTTFVIELPRSAMAEPSL